MGTVVLVLAAGAPWESAAIQLIESRRDLALLRRCMDVDELLAAAASGQAEVALADAEAPGLDARAVDLLRRHGLRVVAVVPAGAAGDQARIRASRAGLGRVVAADALELLPELLLADETPAEVADEPEEALPAGGEPGRVIAVWGPAGAPGRTMLAAACAAELARRKEVTLLVDADPYGGTVAQQLGVLDEVSGLLSAARMAHAGELTTGLPSAVRLIGSHLGVVTGLPRAERWTEVRRETLEELVALASASGHVVLDTGFSLADDDRDRLTLAALELADDVLVVGSADPVGLTRLARGLADLVELVPVEPTVVVNRMRPSLGWGEADVTATITRVARVSAVRFLPEDRPSVDRALVAGRTLLEVAPDGPLARAVEGLVGPGTDRRADQP